MINEERVAIEGKEGVRRATVIPSIERSKAESLATSSSSTIRIFMY